MAEQNLGDPQNAALVLASLQELAQFSRRAGHLTPEAQEALAALVDELSRSVNAAALSSENTARLANSALDLAQALQEHHDPNLLAAARSRLDTAAVRAETQAPLATGVVRRLMEALADLGI